jgi:hypothetical protein
MSCSVQLTTAHFGRVPHSALASRSRNFIAFFTGSSWRLCKLFCKRHGFQTFAGTAYWAPIDLQKVLQKHDGFPASCALTVALFQSAGSDALIHA